MAGQRVRLSLQKHSMIFTPMNVHGHTFGLLRGGARKNSVIVRPMQTAEVDVDATNPGHWAAHCHNICHAETRHDDDAVLQDLISGRARKSA